MIVTQVNPSWLELDRYVEFLSMGFADEWDRRSFEWYLRRFYNGRPADISVRAEGTRVLAGVTSCYRQIQYGSEDPLDACVLSAGTTLPGERGRGHYRALLDASIEECRRNGCAVVLGFVTRENGSGRGLLRLGARAIPSYYIVSRAPRAGARGTAGGGRGLQRWPREVDALRVEELSRGPERSDRVRFHYAQQRDWRWQFLSRPRPVTGLRMAHDSMALVEKVGNTDRLQWLGCPNTKTIRCISTLASASAQAGRNFFMYTVDPLVARAASRLGLGLRRGYLMVLCLNRRASALESLPDAAWQIHSGDRL